MKTKAQRIEEALQVMACVLDRSELQPSMLAFYVHKLQHVPDDRLFPAMERLCSTVQRWPTVSQILEAAGETSQDPDGLARQMADKIVEGIRRFGSIAGPARLPALKEFLGELTWELVQKLGGWSLLCETTEDDALPTLKAQWRESGKALIAARARGENTALPPSDGIVRPQLTTNGAILRLATVEH